MEKLKLIDRVVAIKGERTGFIFLGETGNLYTLFNEDYPNGLKTGNYGEIWYTWHDTGGSDKFFITENQPENIPELLDKYINRLKEKFKFRVY
jgi:hypothetical protein